MTSCITQNTRSDSKIPETEFKTHWVVFICWDKLEIILKHNGN